MLCIVSFGKEGSYGCVCVLVDVWGRKSVSKVVVVGASTCLRAMAYRRQILVIWLQLQRVLVG